MDRLLAAEQLRKALQMFAATLEDERALEIATVFPAWAPDQYYTAGAVISYGDEMVKPAGLTGETLMTATPGGAVSVVNSDGSTSELYGTCVKENGTTYVSQTALLRALDLYLAD